MRPLGVNCLRDVKTAAVAKLALKLSELALSYACEIHVLVNGTLSSSGRIRSVAPNSRQQRQESHMPVLFIEAPPGIRPEAKRTMIKKLTDAIDEAYHIGDTLIFLREYPAENVAMDGRIQSENPKILEALKNISAAS